MKNTLPMLIDQFNKVARHCNQGSYKTRERYEAAMLRFIDFLAMYFYLLKLKNIDGRHLAAYVLHLQNDGCSASYIKTELSAIRFYHDQIPGAKHRLPSNEELSVELDRRQFSGIDRAWSQDEFERMISVMIALGFIAYACACALARYAGLRIHEVFRIDTAIARKAIKAGEITIKGKGGLVRTVTLCAKAKKALEYMLSVSAPGHKLFVPDGMQTHTAIKQLETFIRKHRCEVMDVGDTREITFHGLRHTYANEKYKEFRKQGNDPIAARLKVSRLLGHNRDDVTNVYIAGAKKEGY